MTPRQSLDQAKLASTAQRRKLRQTALATRERLTPARLADDAKTGARAQIAGLKQDTLAHARAHPIMTALSITALIGWVLRKPLLNHAPSAVNRAYAWASGKLTFREWLANPNLNEAGDEETSHPEIE